MLDSILRSLRAGAGAQALEDLLLAWRSSRDPRVGDAIVRLGARQQGDLSRALRELRGEDLDRAWVDLIRTAPAEELTPLLVGLAAHLETARLTWPLVERLGEREPDPRIARVACRALGRWDTLRHTSAKLAQKLWVCVERHGDPRDAEALDAMTLPPALEGRRQRLVRRLRERCLSGTLSDEGGAALQQAIDLPEVSLARTRAPRASSAAELLELVHQDPDDDAARLVYADFLLEQGDPLGEFVHLQFRQRGPGLSPQAQQRMEGLQRKHQRDWLRPLWPALVAGGRLRVEPPVFERGFLVGAWVAPPPHPLSGLWQRPEWATVRWLKGKPVLGASMRALEEVTSSAELRLADPLPRLRRLEAPASEELLGEPWPALPALQQLALAMGSMEELRCLELLLAQPQASQLRELALLNAGWPLDEGVQLLFAPFRFERVLLRTWLAALELRRSPAGRYDDVLLRPSWALSLRQWELLLAPFRLRPAATLCLDLRPVRHASQALLQRVAEGCAAEVSLLLPAQPGAQRARSGT
jgi:uncharacterized protein (TIGR02996 family)